MTRTFIEVPLFTKRWKEIGLDDNDLHSLQIMLLKDPESGDRKSTRLNSSHIEESRMPSSA